MEALQFSGNDPGAVMYGNFINYYEFHPPEERLKLLPNHLWRTKGNDSQYLCLDIGCNTGLLTTKVFETISSSLEMRRTSSGPSDSCTIIGIDIDPILILRAQELNKYPERVVFRCMDFMNESKKEICQQYLSQHGGLFDVIFCFSVSMWIHLNHGDVGLKMFLQDISEMGSMLVIEPQPWKCYKSAMKRLKKCKKSFPHFQNLEIRENVEEFIEDFLVNSCNFKKVYESPQSQWKRKLIVFQNREPRTKDCERN